MKILIVKCGKNGVGCKKNQTFSYTLLTKMFFCYLFRYNKLQVTKLKLLENILCGHARSHLRRNQKTEQMDVDKCTVMHLHGLR